MRRFLASRAVNHAGPNVTAVIAPKAPRSSTKVVRNVGGVQMLPEWLWRQVFPSATARDSVEDTAKATKDMVKDHLAKFQLGSQPIKDLPRPPPFVLPELKGADIGEHFVRIAMDQSQSYLLAAERLALDTHIPPRPTHFERAAGWTRYNSDGTTTAVPCPLEDACVFDVEVCVTEGHYPTLAIAVTSAAWYGWVSQRLANFVPGSGPGCLPELIPLQAPGVAPVPRLVVGHNVAYDRQRVLEEYHLGDSRLRCLDTLSMHMAVSGMTTHQAAAWKEEAAKAVASDEFEPKSATQDEWVLNCSPPSLKDVFKHWCNKDLPKDRREIFVSGSMEDISADFQNLMDYCANDVDSTFQIFVNAFQSFRQACPHPATFAGILEMGRSVLPVNEGWTQYLKDAQQSFEQHNKSVLANLAKLAEETWPKSVTGEWKTDPWLKHLDWTVIEPKFTKPRFKKDGLTFTKGGEPKLVKGQKMAGFPEWYKNLCTAKKDLVITPRKNVTPYLYRLEWVDKYIRDNKVLDVGFPLFYHEEHKWGYLVPSSSPHKAASEPLPWTALDNLQHKTHIFYKLPHPDGPRANCGSPIASSFVRYIDEGQLRSQYPYAREALAASVACAYWTSSARRIESQFVVWEDLIGRASVAPADISAPVMAVTTAAAGSGAAMGVAGDVDNAPRPRLGLILPCLITMGTVTRRAVESTWLTASNPKKNRIGSELKSKVVAPPGYTFVGADVDSEELWIASLLGDAQFAHSHGSTALGWMTLLGAKSAGTDMHSRTGKTLGISRDQAKIINYARIYGATELFTARLLTQFNPNLTESEAKQTKGKRVTDATDNTWWEGGSESVMFTRLEQLAGVDIPQTPFLRCQLSGALQPRFLKMSNKKAFIRSRVNWVVQSSSVDFLHLMLVSMRHLCDTYKIKARFCISIHDEIRFIVADEDVDRAAFALHITNLWTRSFFAHTVGIQDLPLAVAFFSLVDIDAVLRKEVHASCLTPSNPVPVPPGRTVDIFQCGRSVSWTLDKSG